mmetsp:Transcript_4288/g.8457  ORF Transcript_4288/g.8457 Transcript_4288/m.8457 type:complete len:305 (+) Transcript_4288:1731-2645(+)
MKAVAIGTWKFGEPGVSAAVKVLSHGGSSLDAVECGIRTVELDEKVTSVGFGGLPNRHGVLQLDAAIMDGISGRCGSVLALEHCVTAISVARKVLEQSRHPILAGAGATAFARDVLPEDFRDTGSEVLTAHAKRRFEDFCQDQERQHDRSHSAWHSDTFGLICLDQGGRLAVGCSTSGLQFKESGRVGDSALIGNGLFVDGSVGAACASGDGDAMIRHVLSFLIVELMRSGKNPQEACEEAVERVRLSDGTCQAAVIAMDVKGRVGAHCTRSGFTFVVSDVDTGTRVQDCIVDSNVARWHHTCI